jgi:hypothetical protein
MYHASPFDRGGRSGGPRTGIGYVNTPKEGRTGRFLCGYLCDLGHRAVIRARPVRADSASGPADLARRFAAVAGWDSPVSGRAAARTVPAGEGALAAGGRR